MKSISKIILLLALSSCGSSEYYGKGNGVWDNYDYRHPVPNDIQMPTSTSPDAEKFYRDNDSAYTPPKDFGVCSSEDLMNFSCE